MAYYNCPCAGTHVQRPTNMQQSMGGYGDDSYNPCGNTGSQGYMDEKTDDYMTSSRCNTIGQGNEGGASKPNLGRGVTTVHGMEGGRSQRERCGPEPCGKFSCPKSSELGRGGGMGRLGGQPMAFDKSKSDPNAGNKGATDPRSAKRGAGRDGSAFDGSWSLCKAVIVFCCGVYLTKKMTSVASELG